MQTPSAIAVAPRITPQTSSSSQQITLTVIQTASRRVVSVQEVRDRDQAWAIFEALGEGYDAHIRTPKYSELILSMRSGIQASAPAAT